MYLKTKALVLRVTDYNDRDALLTLMTPEHGKITAKVRGLRRKNSPLVAPCQLLAYSEFTLFEYRGYYTVNEANSVQLFVQLRKDLQLLSLGTYFAQVAELVSQEDTPSGELLSLILNCLYALSDLELPEAQVKAVFELRTACIAGYLPNLHACGSCGNVCAEFFDFSGGTLLCSDCIHLEQGELRRLSAGVIDAMRYIVGSDSKRLFAFTVSNATMKQLAAVSENYLLLQLEQRFSTLDFYKSLLI